MPNVIFAAPVLSENAARVIGAAVSIEGVRLGVVMQDPIEKLPEPLRGAVPQHWRVADALDLEQLYYACIPSRSTVEERVHMPTFRERIENDLPVFFLATLATGFLAGFATYRAIQEAGNVVQIRQSDLDRLKRDAAAGTANDSLIPPVKVKQQTTEPTSTHFDPPAATKIGAIS